MAKEEIPLHRSCGATAVYYRMLEIDPEFQQRQIDLELFTAQMKMLGGASSRISTVKIPVVVHIVYNKEEENISDAQVESQIKVLNKDFRAKNSDIKKVPDVWKNLAADANIEFFLAKDVTAIRRVKTERTKFGINDSVKFAGEGGADVIKPDKILNIWVCNLPGLLGYAQFPGGKPETDGVVINYKAFGTNGTAQAPFNLGRTATHEVGHWLNLRHIWGDTVDCTGTDEVNDTPKAQLPNYGTPTFPHISCNNAPNGDMFMNYMDYVDDKAMFMFTQGQVERMAATFLGPRIGFVE
jgi:hypothetical protein